MQGEHIVKVVMLVAAILVTTAAASVSHRRRHSNNKRGREVYHDGRFVEHNSHDAQTNELDHRDEESQRLDHHNKKSIKMQQKHLQSFIQTEPTTASSLLRRKETNKQIARRNQVDTSQQLNYHVSADVVIRGKYGECPPFQIFKCRDSECIYQTCKDANSWTADGCKFNPISKCKSSKDWKCDCDNALGFFRLNSTTTECVRYDDIRCISARVSCSAKETLTCPSDDCSEKTKRMAYGIIPQLPLCPSDEESVRKCKKPVQCHCKFPFLRYNIEKSSKYVCYNISDSCGLNPVVCTDNKCEVKECLNRYPNSSNICQSDFDDKALYNCKKPIKCKCMGDELTHFILADSDTYCALKSTCDKEINNIGGDYTTVQPVVGQDFLYNN